MAQQVRRSGLRSGRRLVAALLPVALLGTTACAGTVSREGDLSRVRIMAPASPGGGWDTTSRVLQRTLQREGLVRNVQVFNVEARAASSGSGSSRARTTPPCS